jgi:HK97 gp10 family phage protein
MIEFKITGADNVLEMLKQLPPEVVSKSGGPVKLALKKAATVIQKQEIANLDAVIQNVVLEDGTRQSTGLLRKNIVVTRGKAPIGGKGERYLVRVKRKKYETLDKRDGNVTTLKTARLLEYGSTNQPARPFIRSAFNQKKTEAVNVAVKDLKDRIEKIVQKRLKGR